MQDLAGVQVSAAVLMPEPDEDGKPKRLLNQGGNIPFNKVIRHKGLQFQRYAEKTFFEACEVAGIACAPLPALRIGEARDRRTRYPDFLLVVGGILAIVEIDGGAHMGREAEDRMRERVIRRQTGICIFERFTEEEVLADPHGCVGEVVSYLRLTKAG